MTTPELPPVAVAEGPTAVPVPVVDTLWLFDPPATPVVVEVEVLPRVPLALPACPPAVPVPVSVTLTLAAGAAGPVAVPVPVAVTDTAGAPQLTPDTAPQSTRMAKPFSERVGTVHAVELVPEILANGYPTQ